MSCLSALVYALIVFAVFFFGNVDELKTSLAIASLVFVCVTAFCMTDFYFSSGSYQCRVINGGYVSVRRGGKWHVNVPKKHIRRLADLD